MNVYPFRMIARCSALGVSLLVCSATAHADDVKLFLLGGQSNMVGTGTSTSALPTTPVNLQRPQDDVLFYVNSLMTLRPGSGQTFGPEVTFGRKVADAFPDQTFGLIKYAVSGSD